MSQTQGEKLQNQSESRLCFDSGFIKVTGSVVKSFHGNPAREGKNSAAKKKIRPLCLNKKFSFWKNQAPSRPPICPAAQFFKSAPFEFCGQSFSQLVSLEVFLAFPVPQVVKFILE
jgi:hypothetical protein